MSKSKIMEKLLQEEKEAEELMYGNEESPSDEVPSPETEEDDVAPGGESDDDSSDDQDTSQPKPKRENWKKRYVGYKTATDETIAELRALNAELSLQNQEMNKKLNELAKELNSRKPAVDPFEGVFTQEDIDLLGPEALEAMKKAALATKGEQKPDDRYEKLEEELKRIKEKELEKQKREAAKAHEESLSDLRVRLEKAVPNFEKVDNDPKFGEWLEDVDTFSDVIRMDLFSKAVNGRDVAAVARFYNEFMDSSSKKKESFLDDYITPTGDGANTPSLERRGGRTYTLAEYNKFMDDVTKGRYRGREKEAQKLEMMFDKAFVEDRVIE